jgi:hypothetical protein
VEEAPLKYLILIYGNPAFREMWETLSDAQRVEFGRGHIALTEDLAASGELIVSEGLADPSLAKRVSVREGRTMTTDFVEGVIRWHNRVIAYALVLVTDRYPPFRLAQ